MPCDGARAPGRPCFFHIFVLIDMHAAAGGRAKTRGPALALRAARSQFGVRRCTCAPLRQRAAPAGRRGLSSCSSSWPKPGTNLLMHASLLS